MKEVAYLLKSSAFIPTSKTNNKSLGTCFELGQIHLLEGELHQKVLLAELSGLTVFRRTVVGVGRVQLRYTKQQIQSRGN